MCCVVLTYNNEVKQLTSANEQEQCLAVLLDTRQPDNSPSSSAPSLESIRNQNKVRQTPSDSIERVLSGN